MSRERRAGDSRWRTESWRPPGASCESSSIEGCERVFRVPTRGPPRGVARTLVGDALMSRSPHASGESPFVFSLLGTGTSTVRMLFKVWGALSEEERSRDAGGLHHRRHRALDGRRSATDDTRDVA